MTSSIDRHLEARARAIDRFFGDHPGLVTAEWWGGLHSFELACAIARADAGGEIKPQPSREKSRDENETEKGTSDDRT